MSRVFIEGFETRNYNRIDETSVGGGEQIVSTSGLSMVGNYCLDVTGVAEYAEYNVTAGGTDLYGSFYWRHTQGNQYYDLFAIGDDNEWFDEILSWTDGRVAAYRQSTQLAISTLYPFNFAGGDRTYFIEFYFSVADSGGRAVIKVDGTTCVDYTGDTKPSTDSTITRIALGRSTQSYFANNRAFSYYDNVVLDNASYPGSTMVLELAIDGAGNSAQWDPSAGSNYQCIDERPYSKDDYVSTNSVDQLDTHSIANLVSTNLSVKAITVDVIVETFGSPTPTNIALALRTNSTDYVGSDQSIPAAGAEKTLVEIWENNPDTASAWTPSEINALEIGYKSKT